MTQNPKNKQPTAVASANNRQLDAGGKLIEFNHFRLKLARQVRALTQKELAEKIGIDEHTIWRMEHDAIKPNQELLDKFCAVLDFPEGFFFEPGGIYPGEVIRCSKW